MSTARDSNDLPRIAAQAAWVRRLAVALAHDVHAGEDIAQDALLAASRGHGIADLRAWLAGTVRNLARLRRRGDERRAARELRGARSERVDDPALAFERLELQEALLGAVRELSEPYRTAVLLRWFEGLEPEEIARRTGTPVRTVETRLHRALVQLRETLDRRSQGDRSRWLAAWLPALSKSSPGWKWLLLMDLKLKLAVAGLAAAIACSVWYLHDTPRELQTAALAGTPIEREAGENEKTSVAPLEQEVPAASERELQPSATPPGTAKPEEQTRSVHGKVIDLSGAQLAGIELVLRTGDSSHAASTAHATSDALGLFDFRTAANPGHGSIEAVSSEWVGVYEPVIRNPDPQNGYVLVLGRPRQVEGFVQDESAVGIAGARVWFGPSEPLSSPGMWTNSGDTLCDSLGVDVDSSRLRNEKWTAQSSSSGSFSIPGVDSPRGFWIGARAPGYDSARVALPVANQPVIVVLHKRSNARPGELYGRVVGPEGRPISQAYLRLGVQRAGSDDRGEFVIRIDTTRPGARLIALHRDWRPVVQPCLSASPSEPGAWPDPLVLVMTQPQPGISGTVVDPAGKPVAGVDVLTIDPMSWNETLGMLGEAPLENENSAERVLGDAEATTDAEGRFRMNAVAGHSSRLLVRDRRTLEIAVSEPILAGTKDAKIVFGRSGRCRFAGQVVDLHGNPIAGGSIAPMRTVAGSGPRAEVRVDSDGVPTDAKGRFEIPDKSCDIAAFLVWSDPGAPAKIVAIDPGADREALLIRVGQIARVQVEVRTTNLKADTLVFLDASGKQRQVGVKLKDGWAGGDDWSIGEGRTEVLIVSEEAKTLVLKLKGEEVARVAIDLDPARITLVQP